MKMMALFDLLGHSRYSFNTLKPEKRGLKGRDGRKLVPFNDPRAAHNFYTLKDEANATRNQLRSVDCERRLHTRYYAPPAIAGCAPWAASNPTVSTDQNIHIPQGSHSPYPSQFIGYRTMFIDCVSARRRLYGLRLRSLRTRWLEAGCRVLRLSNDLPPPARRSKERHSVSLPPPSLCCRSASTMCGVMDLRSRATRLLSILSVRLRLLRLPRRWELGLPRNSGLTVLCRLRLWYSPRSFRCNERSDEE